MARDAVKQQYFDRVHRFGNMTQTMMYRRIVAKFAFCKQKEIVRNLRKNLEHTDFDLYQSLIRCHLGFAQLQYVSSGFRCRVITGSLMILY